MAEIDAAPELVCLVAIVVLQPILLVNNPTSCTKVLYHEVRTAG